MSGGGFGFRAWHRVQAPLQSKAGMEIGSTTPYRVLSLARTPAQRFTIFGNATEKMPRESIDTVVAVRRRSKSP
jgi:hypothetical protein